MFSNNWTKADASTLRRLLKMWVDVPQAGRTLYLKDKKRVRFRLDSFLKWAPNICDSAFLTRLKRQLGKTNRRYARLLPNLLSGNMCACCGQNARITRLLCVECSGTEKGIDFVNRTNVLRVRNAWAEKGDEILKRQKATNKKRYGAEFPWQNAKVIARKKKRYLERYGMTHHFHNPEIHLKQQRSAFRIRETKIEGKRFQYQGYESIALKRLVERFGVQNVLSQYEVNFPALSLPFYYRPDMYVRSPCVMDGTRYPGFYVEVKSTYTLTYDAFLAKNRKKARSLIAECVPLVWFVAKPDGTLQRVPRDWYKLSKKELNLLISSK